MLRDYRGSVAVITGAAGGLGRALAAALADRQCHLALIDNDSASLAKTASELARPGILITQHTADVSGNATMEGVAVEIATAHHGVHLLINNAAMSASASFENIPTEEFERIIRVNLLGAVHGCRVFLPLLRQHRPAQIVNVCSCFAWHGYPRKTAYASSKAALRAFSESLRLELSGAGVGVTLFYPGPLATDIVGRGFCDSDDLRDREQRFLCSRGLSLDRVARRCLDQLPNNPGRIVAGLDYHLLDMLVRLSPRLAARAIAFGAARAGF